MSDIAPRPPDPDSIADPEAIGNEDLEAHIKVYHELMSRKVRDILLVSTPYDAFILEEDGSLTSKIIHEYRGLNLSRPPRLTKAASGAEALQKLDERSFDLIITMPNLADMDTVSLVWKIKARNSKVPVILLAHSPRDIPDESDACTAIEDMYVWTGDANLLMALIKSVEDRINVADDTRLAMVRVLLLVEDSPLYRSFFLPIIYRVLVKQTLSVLEEGLNEEHRLLKMRARPKILVAENYEDGLRLFRQYKPYVFGVITDTRFPLDCVKTADAGFQLLSDIRAEVPYLPALMLSSEPENRVRAEREGVVFFEKEASDLQARIEDFFRDYLGFGDFVFRRPDRSELGRAGNLRQLERLTPEIPDEPLRYHAERNHFANWLMARSEVALASRFIRKRVDDFPDIAALRRYIVESIHALRRCQQRGVVVQFDPEAFDPDVADFVKIGSGSLGGKARGLAFVSSMLGQTADLRNRYAKAGLRLMIPKTLVISTDGFESFREKNGLVLADLEDCSDREIQARFQKADLPVWLYRRLEAFLKKVAGPVSIRSSSLLEDAHIQSYAGLYKTYMIPNTHADFFVRLHHLISAVKMVYASTHFEKPRRFADRVARHFRDDSMAVIIQQLAGGEHGDHFYPAITGVAQSRNVYPVGRMRPEDGVARIALGLGQILDEGDVALRFCPRHPNFLPQFSAVNDILENAQREFYALQVRNDPDRLEISEVGNLVRREVADAEDEYPVRALASTYDPADGRIRDTGFGPGPKLLTFAPILKHGSIPLPELLSEVLTLGEKGMGGPVEIEFALDLQPKRNTFFLLQIRPMAAGEEAQDVAIREAEISQAFCVSIHSLGHGRDGRMADIVYVRREGFDPAATTQIAREIGSLNGALVREGRPYLLAGPGRWGTADRWLGIPVTWNDINGVGAMIEVRDGRLPADASHGSHFFQKITSRGIHYVTMEPEKGDFFDWEWVDGLPAERETAFLRHVRLERPFLLKNDGRTARCVMVAG